MKDKGSVKSGIEQLAIEETLPIAERFVSINGEGAHAGKLSAFIRFSGCNLRCNWCDTAWAQDLETTVTFYSVEELAAWVASQPVSCVTITGGEPLLQLHLGALIDAFDRLEGIEVIEVETNGSMDLTSLVQDRSAKLKVTMDHKLPSSGMADQMITNNLKLLALDDVVKFVVGDEDDLHAMKETIDRYELCERCRVYVSPVFGQIDPADIVEFLKAQNLPRVTLQLQLHKIIWPDAERGV